MSTESTENIRQVAKVLLEGLYVKMNEMKHKSLGIVFIAHSLGGLVVKKVFFSSFDSPRIPIYPQRGLYRRSDLNTGFCIGIEYCLFHSQ